MRFKAIFLVSALTLAGIILFTSIQEVNSSPRRGGGGGSRGGSSSSRGSSSRGSSSGGSRYGGGSYGGSKSKSYGSSGGYKSKSSSKSFAKKHWKKAVAFGAGAYVGHKLSSKLSGAFTPSIWHYGGYNGHFGYDDWNRYSRIDGALCRRDQDCTWIDRNLGCDDREFVLGTVRGGWPFKADLIGRCTCENGLYFDNNIGACVGGMAVWLIAVIVVAVLIGTCLCCCCLCYCARN